jgi:hypothetical protein|tara:strand:+ start:36 stop:1247 length:1212 start_codon:yes stop_codon:yes gene_type:complete
MVIGQPDNSGAEHNWLSSLGAKLKEMGYDLDMDSVADMAVSDLTDDYEYPIPEPRDSGENDMRAPGKELPKTTCMNAARIMGGDFNVDYSEAGFLIRGNTVAPIQEAVNAKELVIPRYTKGSNAGKPLFQFIYRTDTLDTLGVVSGAYPARDGYNHIYQTMELMFPETCTGITLFGAGERAVIAQELDDPIDLGDGDLIQPYLYTRMSLNRQWSTQCIPKLSRLSCENALGSSGAIISVKATKNHDTRLTLQAEIMRESMNQAEAVRRMAFVMKNQRFTDVEFDQMVKQLIPEPESEHQAAHTRRANKIAACKQAWRQERTADDSRLREGNMWIAYNAVQGAEQHVINSPNTLIDEKGEKMRDQSEGLSKTLDGKTPLADGTESYLISLLGGADRYTELAEAI